MLRLFIGAATAAATTVTVTGKEGVPPALFLGDDYSITPGASGIGHNLDFKKGDKWLYSAGEDLIVGVPLTVSGAISADSLYADGLPQWSLIALDTFEDVSEVNTWTASGGAPPTSSTCGVSSNAYMGPIGGGREIRKRFDIGKPHSKVEVSFNVHFLDNWNGEAVQLKLDGEPVWAQSHTACPETLSWLCDKYAINLCGHSAPDKLAQHVSVEINHDAPSLVAEFSSTLPVNKTGEVSYGIDDFHVKYITADK